MVTLHFYLPIQAHQTPTAPRPSPLQHSYRHRLNTPLDREKAGGLKTSSRATSNFSEKAILMRRSRFGTCRTAPGLGILEEHQRLETGALDARLLVLLL